MGKAENEKKILSQEGEEKLQVEAAKYGLEDKIVEVIEALGGALP